MTHPADVAVAGGGPAGAVAALLCARAGLRVVLADAGRPPAPRVESLPVAGQALLKELGLAHCLDAAALGRPAEMRMWWRTQAERRPFAPEARPVLLDRVAFHAALQVAARAAGVECIAAPVAQVAPEGLILRQEARQTVPAAVTIDARGRAAGGLAALGPARAALPFRGRTAAGAAAMGLAALERGWLWWAVGADGRVDGALVTVPAALAGLDAAGRQVLLDRAAAACPAPPAAALAVQGRPAAATLAAVADPAPAPGLVRVGDAALARDPVGAHGLVHALRSGVHAAAAATTWRLRPATADAATAFLRHRHAADCRAAAAATARAYADQSRHPTPFWQETARASTHDPSAPDPAPGAVLRLAAQRGPVPELAEGLIGWTEGLHLPATGECLSRLGPYSATDLARRLDPPAPLPALLARLAPLAGPAAAAMALDWLLRQGALRPLKAQTAA